MQILSKLDAVDRWLLQPEKNAAGRLGLYRILFVVFTLIYAFPTTQYWQFENLPQYMWQPRLPLLWMQSPPSGTFMFVLDLVYIASLVLLGLGLRTRLMTIIVLLSSTMMICIVYSIVKIDHNDTFMRIYIPLIMAFAPWGKTFSLDSVLLRRRGQSAPAPTESTLRYSWPILFLFWMLCVMFMMSGILKMIPPGQWLRNPDLLTHFMLQYNVSRDPIYIRHVLSHLPLVPTVLMGLAVAFETLYPLAVINKDWRRFYVSSTVLFHIGTGIGLGIAFVEMLILYVLFFDLWFVYDRFFPKAISQRVSGLIERMSSSVLIAGALGFTALVVILHFTVPAVPDALHPRTILRYTVWYPAVALALYGIANSLPQIVRGFLSSIRRRGSVPSAESL